MKKLLFLILFCAVPFLFALDASNYQNFAKVGSISSQFTMHKHLSIASKPLVSSGRFYFERPGFLRWEYESPAFATSILLDGEKAHSWRGKGENKKITDVSSQPFAKMLAQQIYTFVSMDIDVLSAAYEINAFEDGLILTPKDNSPKQVIKEIKLYMNAAKDALTQVDINERGGDKTVIFFTSVILNAPTPPEVKKP